MKQLSRIVVLFVLVALMASPVNAQGREKKKGKRGHSQRGAVMGMMKKKLEKANLSDEQEAKIKKIVATYQPKLKDIGADAKPTVEQRQAGKAAREKAEAAGKKGKELREAMSAAMNLTDTQKEARKKQQVIMREMQKEVLAVLTPEQLKQIRSASNRKDRPNKGKGKGNRGKKRRSDK